MTLAQDCATAYVQVAAQSTERERYTECREQRRCIENMKKKRGAAVLGRGRVAIP
jgi:hypothetical protein